MKNIFVLVFLFSLSEFNLYAQVDSSAAFTSIIAGNATKNWYTHPVIIDNPRDVRFSTLTFNMKTKAGSLARNNKSRDIIGNFKKFSGWKVQKKDDNYLLILSTNEKYIIRFTSIHPTVLLLGPLDDKKHAGLSLAGQYFERALELN